MRPVIKGVFRKSLSKEAEKFSASHSFDRKLYLYDIKGSIAWAKMLKKIGILNEKELKLIIEGLKEIQSEIEKGKFCFSDSLEDIHMHIESALTKKIGDTAKKLHTGRSRNEQVAIDERMYCKDKINEIKSLIRKVQKSLIKKASEYYRNIIPAYTHLQQAQPVSIAHYLLAYVEMFERDIKRYEDLFKRVDVMVLGSSAIAGSGINIDRKFLMKELGFKKISFNSIDAVSDRDFIIEMVFCSSVTGMHLSRLAEDIIIFKTKEFEYISLGEEFCTGSSLMPQKVNPDIAELIRGKTARLYGSLVQELVLMKALPLAYNRDMQEDKEYLFDSIETIISTLKMASEMILSIKFNVDEINKKISSQILATDIAEYLVKKGVPFRKAHEIVGKIVRYCIEKKKDLTDLKCNEMKRFDGNFNEDIEKVINFRSSVNLKKVIGGTSFSMVKKEISKWKKKLSIN